MLVRRTIQEAHFAPFRCWMPCISLARDLLGTEYLIPD